MRLLATTLKTVQSAIAKSKRASISPIESAVAVKTRFFWGSCEVSGESDSRSLRGSPRQFGDCRGATTHWNQHFLTVFEDGFDRHSDEDVLSRANELGRVVFTQDVDFIALADQWLAGGRPFAGVVFAHQLKVTIGQAIRDLELVCRVLTPAEVANQLIRLPL